METDEKKIAYLQTQTLCAYAEIEGMKAENAYRASHGSSPAYNSGDFDRVPVRYGLTHNQVIEYLRG